MGLTGHTRLSSNIADNILLATIFDYSNQGYKTILLTGDQGMRLSAISREISCIDPEIYKLPEEPSAIEVELRKCKLELEKLKNRQPALSFSEKNSSKTFFQLDAFSLNLLPEPKAELPHYRKPLSSEQTKLIRDQSGTLDYEIQKKIQLLSYPSIPMSEYERWESECQKYDAEYTEYCKKIDRLNCRSYDII